MLGKDLLNEDVQRGYKEGYRDGIKRAIDIVLLIVFLIIIEGLLIVSAFEGLSFFNAALVTFGIYMFYLIFF